MHILYRLYSVTDELLYVGRTMSPRGRFHEHSKHDRWNEVATIRLQHFIDAGALDAAEREAIRTENPLWNVHRYANRRMPVVGREFERVMLRWTLNAIRRSTGLGCGSTWAMINRGDYEGAWRDIDRMRGAYPDVDRAVLRWRAEHAQTRLVQ